MKLGLLKETKEVWGNFILNQLQNYTVKDMEFDQGHVLNNMFYIFPSTKDCCETHLESIPDKNAFQISLKGLSTGFNSQQFKFKGSFISLKGAAQVEITNVTLNATFQFLKHKLADGRLVPAFSIIDFGINFPSESLSIVVQGNIETKVSKEFKKVFLYKLKPQIEQGLQLTLKSHMIL